MNDSSPSRHYTITWRAAIAPMSKHMPLKNVWLMMVVSALTTVASAQSERLPEGRQGTYGVVLRAGPAFPVGEFSDLFATGFGGFVEVPYHLGEEFQVFIGLGGLFWNVDNEKVNQQYTTAGGAGTVNLDAPFRMIPLIVGINYVLSRGQLRPYLTLAFSVYFQKLETSGTITLGNLITPLLPTTQTWSQGAFALGLGTEYQLNDTWAIDLNARFGAVIDYEARVLIGTGSNDVVTRAIRFFSLMGGISYTFR